MKHLDAHAVRERLNAISLAIATLERTSEDLRHHEIAAIARRALEEIARLVTNDEIEEHRNGRVCALDGASKPKRKAHPA